MAQHLIGVNDMKIFVRSSGVSQDCGYRWLPEEPYQWNQISGLIESSSPSVVLTRSNKQLSLFVTGLDSPDRKDFRDRLIRHCIAWTCSDNSYDEMQIRAIAVQALRGLLSSQVDQYIKLGGEDGFEVYSSELKSLSQSFLRADIESQNLPVPEDFPKIGKNSQNLRDDLANKLQQYSLPKDYKLIVIATGVKSEDSLEKAGAWRSLSNLVKSENWRNLSGSEGQQSSFFGVAIAIIVAVIVVIALILLVVLLHPFSPKPEVTPSPTHQTIEETSQTQHSLTSSPEPLKEVLTPSVNSEIESVPLEN
jgi:hypothetical protein